MKLTSVIKAPEGSIAIGLAEAAAVYAIYMSALPTHTDIRSADPHNVDVEGLAHCSVFAFSTTSSIPPTM